MPPARLEKCGNCGCLRHLHTGPTWPLANGACLMCDKGCRAFEHAPADDPGASPGSQETAAPRPRE